MPLRTSFIIAFLFYHFFFFEITDIDIFFFFFHMFHVVFCLFHNHAGEYDKSDKVWNGHETVHDVCQYPDGFQFEESAAGDEDYEDEAIRKNSFGTAEVNDAPFTIVVPSQNGGEGEEDEAYHEHVSAEDRECSLKCAVGQSGAVQTFQPLAGNDDGKSG